MMTLLTSPLRGFFVLTVLLMVFSPRGAQSNSFEPRSLELIFKERFFDNYEANQCGKNIMSFLDAARVENVDASRAQILEITNPGNSVFGMVNAERARGGPRGPQEKNWYHHVILELDCHIFDFDFENEPTVVPLSEYFERMFFKERTGSQSFTFFVGRERKLKEYQVEAIRAPVYYKSSRSVSESETFKLEDLLRQCQ